MIGGYANPFAKLPRWQQIAIFILAVLFGLSMIDEAKTYYERHTAPTSTESAQSKMIGVWTYTEPIDTSKDTFPFEWTKWDIRPDGKMMVYNAQPTANSWGNGELVDYEIITNKFSDTGERWFGIKQKGYALFGIYQNDKIILNLRPTYSTTGAMVRGDKSPFSN